MDTAPVGGDDPPSRSLSPTEGTARTLGDRLRAAARPIRVLDAVQWDRAVEESFLARGGCELPPVTAHYYATRPLGFDPDAKRRELLAIEGDTLRRLGRDDPFARLLRRRCRQYNGTVELLARRGSPEFPRLAAELYGTPTPAEDAEISSLFAALIATAPPPPDTLAATYDAAAAASLLAGRLRRALGSPARFRVKLSDRLLADAAAGGSVLKLRRGAAFTVTDLALLEVHEGWVHLGTTLNGRRQRAGSFLSQGPPATTVTQEGLAVFCELLAGVCHAGRVRRLWRRYQAVRMAQAGADFLDVYRHFRADGDDPRLSYHQTVRVFRGSLPTGRGPFAKDLSYALGLVRVLRATRAALRGGRVNRLSLLFCGKTAVADLGLLTPLTVTGLLRRPSFLPPPFDDPTALARRLATLPHAGHALPRPHHFAETAAPTPG
jgi:uncharacterized protein (TIGR02421 family)